MNVRGAGDPRLSRLTRILAGLLAPTSFVAGVFYAYGVVTGTLGGPWGIVLLWSLMSVGLLALAYIFGVAAVTGRDRYNVGRIERLVGTTSASDDDRSAAGDSATQRRDSDR